MDKCLEILLNVIKNIFCSGITDDKKHSLCHLIDMGNLPSLKIIEPDGSFIKKDQIIELISDFSRSSQYTKENIYIIKCAEKMNKESANTLLKFLEEPNGLVIGFFITNHIDNVLSTIQSRCQHIDVNFDNEIYEKINITKDEYTTYYEMIKRYLYQIEIEKKELILYNRQNFIGQERQEITNIFKIILEIYLNVLNGNMIDDNFTFLLNLSKTNLLKKIDIIIEFLKEITYNVNLDLLLDKFIIEMDGVNNESL